MIELDANRLLNGRLQPGSWFEERLEDLPSPDGRFVIVTSHRFEPRNGFQMCFFALVTREAKVLNRFEALVGLPGTGCWSPDGAYWVIAACTSDFEYPHYFIHDPAKNAFALIRVGNPYPLEVIFNHPREFTIRVRQDQVDAANLGGDSKDATYPCERFKASPGVSIEIDRLAFHPISELQQVTALLETLGSHDVELQADGYFPYHGKPLVSTDQVLDGRPMEVHHLEAFAGVGDAIAKQWLEVIKKKTGGEYSRWDNVLRHLGRRKAGR